MPSAGLLLQTLAVNAEGYIITGGYLRNLTTDVIDGTSTSPNMTVYVKAGGGLTVTKPTGAGNLIQNVAKVARSGGNNSGSLLVSSILRTNDIPNLTTGKIWVGDSNTVESTVIHLDESNNRLGINNTSPSYSLDVTGDANISGALTVSGGDVILGGTGRIQGIDTVSTGTDAANKTYVDTQVAGIVDSAPATLDTLNELAAALGDDANFSTTVTNSIATKLPLAGGTLTGGLTGTTADFSGNVTIGTGIIKPNIGSDIAITQGAIGLRINDAASALSPTTATSNNDNAVDLGVSNIRFRNLYMGGNMFAGRYLNLTDSDYTYIQGTHTGAADGEYCARVFGYGDSTFYGSLDILRHDVDDGEIRFRTRIAGTATDVMAIVDGNVGIGTTSPTSLLQIKKATLPRITLTRTGILDWFIGNPSQGTSNTFSIGTNSGSNTEILNLSNTGNVGIGTTSPHNDAGGLSISVTSSTDQLYLERTGSGTGRYYLGTASNSFYIVDDAQSATRMVIDSSGNVAIGISFATAKLQIHNTNAGAAAVAAYLVNASTSLNTETRLAFAAHTNDDIATNRYSYISTINTSGSNGQDMIFATNATGAGGSERMRITSGGYVGIANNNPASLLSVGSVSYGSTARIDCIAADSQNAEIRAYGNSKGTGVVYVGQSTSYGGGIAYNGYGSTAYGDFGTDMVKLFGRENGTSHKVADWSYGSSDKTFNFYGSIEVGEVVKAEKIYSRNGSWTTTGSAWNNVILLSLYSTVSCTVGSVSGYHPSLISGILSYDNSKFPPVNLFPISICIT